MVTYSQMQHPWPKGERVFQDICLQLLRHEWGDTYAELHGRSGQAQQGVDISGSDKRGGFAVAGCQCKGTETNDKRRISQKDILEEINRAKSYEPPLNLLIIAYAGVRDASLQAVVRKITLDHRAKGMFDVVLWPWDEIIARAEKYPDVRIAIYIEDGLPRRASCP